jgi:hypothetical protein
MAVKSRHRRPSLIWSRLHFLLRFLGLTGVLALCAGLVMLEPTNWSDVWTAVQSITLQSPVAIDLIVGGSAAVVLALLVEVLVISGVVAGRRSAFGFNAVFQVVLACVVLVAVNVFSAGLHLPVPEALQEYVGGRESLNLPAHYVRIDTTREQIFSLPADLRDRLRKLDRKANTTIIVYQRHKTFGNLTDKPDRYDYAAERKVVEKVRDLVDLLREVGPQLNVQVLDVEEEGFEDRLDRLTKDAPELRKAIEAAPENSIFIASRDPAHKDHTFVQQMSFNELYQLDRVRSKDDNDERGNLVLLGQGEDGRGIRPFVRRILNVQQRRPRVGVLAIHRVLTTRGDRDELTLAGLRKTLEANGFDVRDVVIKKGWEGPGGLQPAADTFEESSLERLEARIESLDDDIKELRDEMKGIQRALADVEPKKGEDTEKKLKELSAKYGRNFVGGKVTARGREMLLEFLKRELTDGEASLATAQAERQRLEKERAGLDVDQVAESRRLSDVKAKLNYTIADCDILFVPRLTRMVDGELIPPRYYRMTQEQVEVVRAFLKAGKPVFACLGPTNEPRGMNLPPQLGPPGPDDFENMLSDLGFHLGPQTVLFSSDARAFGERRGNDLDRGAEARVSTPLLDFDTPARAGYPRLYADWTEAEDNPLREGLRVMAHSVGSGFDLRLRFPRPVYFKARKGKALGYEPTFLLSASGWNERQPFPTPERRPRYTSPKPDDPDRGTLDEPRRAAFPVGAVADVEIPPNWGASATTRARVAVIGQGDVFTGPQLSPARERLFLQTANWLLGRDDYLPRGDQVWSYPRLAFTPDDWQHRRWLDAATWGLPVLFAYLGLVVLLYRRLR